ncbi:hypothetical protein F4780DRAFT_179047 [Xylariomycetidae sp. FL0641]|nr:hypothetical protein F4780DRAFT_179047 [Xylariomycetidae sp. FL0641]
MLSLASLLNPAPPGASMNRFPPSPAASSPTTSLPDDSGFSDRPAVTKHAKMPKDAVVFTKSKPKGQVNYMPFEKLDEASLREVRKFQVFPFGKIQEYCRHIPYNSGKKDFYEKTGRESFEVFQYVFRVPGDDTEYAVMWDYNVGLVRMTPFFKCCKYPKTTPAKMLNSNPGLKEITHSITGGSIMAQGYWMPYHCAKAVCATFCHNIAGALIPIFGPDFPSQCTPAEAPEYSRMIIDPAIVMRSTREAEHFRRIYTNMLTSTTNGSIHIGASIGSRQEQDRERDHRLPRNPYDHHNTTGGRYHHHHHHHHQHPRQRLRRPLVSAPGVGCNSPYATETDGEISPAATMSDRGSLGRGNQQRFMYSPAPTAPLSRPSSGWTPANAASAHHHAHSHSHSHSSSHPHSQYENAGPSPWLSAIPRFTTTAHLPPPYPSSHAHAHSSSQSVPYPPSPWRAKRPAEHLDEPAYGHEHSRNRAHGHARSQATPAVPSTAPSTALSSPLSGDREREGDRTRQKQHQRSAEGGLGADKKAALLLMNLSVRDALGKAQRKVAEEFGSRTGADRGGPRGAGSGGNSIGTVGLGIPPPPDGSLPRIKRVRSNSM